MTAPVLALLGTGTYFPPAHSTRELAVASGADPTDFTGWDHVHVATDDDHPSTMGAAAAHQALAASGVDAARVKLVVSVGMSRDYQPSWSVATEIMGHFGAPSSCLGIDLTVGCLSSLAALNLALGWPSLDDGVAVIVAAERWSYTVDRSRVDLKGLWGHSDGAAAVVVTTARPDRPGLSFLGAEFISNSEANGYVLVKYGGTRFPMAPPEETPYLRQIRSASTAAVREFYIEGYRRAFAALHRRFDIEPTYLVSNQPSRQITARLPELVEVPSANAVQTGPDHGHMGTADVFLGLHLLLQRQELKGPVVAAASTPYAFGAGIFV